MSSSNQPISQLSEHQVFVFGSNKDGFHGSGAAGLAWRGTPDRHWREDIIFTAALRTPADDPARTGRWAILGQARGFMQGHSGKSYGIQTVIRPGQRRSVPLSEIAAQLRELQQFACQHPELEFLITPVGTGLAGYTHQEIQTLFQRLTWPTNCRFV